MQEKRILVLVNGSKETFENGVLGSCISVFAEDIARVIIEDRGAHLGKWISVVNYDGASSSIPIRDAEKAVDIYKKIVLFLVNTEKVHYAFSE